MSYVTYGKGNKFDITKLKIDLSYTGRGKPKEAWWGSPVDAEYSWKEWCISNECCPGKKDSITVDEYFSDDNKILWDLKKGTKVLMINTMGDLYKYKSKGYIIYEGIILPEVKDYDWNYKKILKDGYSAIQLNDPCIGHRFTSTLELLMNTWDCESIVVLDPSKIVTE